MLFCILTFLQHVDKRQHYTSRHTYHQAVSVSMLKLTRHVAALISFPAGRFCDATPAVSLVNSPQLVVTAAEQTARLRRRPHHPTAAATVRSNVQLQCTPDFIYAALS